MTFSRFATKVALSATLASAAVLPRDDCASIPSDADPDVLQTVYKITKAANVSDRVLLATFETAWVESHANVLNCGDADSVGVFQQRPSQGWGSKAQCLDVTHSTQSFLSAALSSAANFPDYSPGQIAQAAQTSEFPDRYDNASAKATALIAQAQTSLGLSVDLPEVDMSVSSGAGAQLATGTLSTACGAFYTAQKGDNCTDLKNVRGSSATQLVFWNPSLTSHCGSVKSGLRYCVSSRVAVPPSSAATGIDKMSCTRYSDVVTTAQSCADLQTKYGVSTSRLVQLNDSLNSKCSNLKVGKSYCLTSI